MSFNPYHTTLTRANYEEAFLLYVDGELNAEGMAAVEAFVLLHPDLQEELDLLLSTKLEGEEWVLEGKENLLSQQMQLELTDEDLLLYVDDELNGAEKAAVERRLAADEGYRLQHNLIKDAKLVVGASVVYPNKGELYRHAEKRIAPKMWMRVAAAVLLLLGLSIIWVNKSNNDPQTPPPVVQLPQQKGAEEPSIPVQGNLPASNKQQDVALQSPEVIANKTVKEDKTQRESSEKIRPKSPLVIPDERDRVIAVRQPTSDPLNTTIPTTDPTVQQSINNPTVTTATHPTYATTDGTATEAMVSTAVAINNDEKKGSVRGFLRKASRFIECRTGINPVNEDDELLIGAVALKLK